MDAEARRLHPHAHRVVVLLGLYALVGGLVSFLGWVLDVPRMTDWEGHGICIQPNTTLAVMAAGVALLLLSRAQRRAALVLGLFVGLVGATALFQYLSRVDLGIDTLLLFGRTWGAKGTIVYGRMGPPGAISWTILGAGLCLAAWGVPWMRRATPIFGLAAVCIAMLSLIGYLYGVDRLYAIPHLTTIALQTSTMILAVGVGLIAAVPERQPVRRLSERSTTGSLLRRSLPLVILLPIAVGWVRNRGEVAGLYDTGFGSALRSVVEVVLLSGLLWWTFALLARRESQLGASRERLESVLASVSDNFQIVDSSWRFSYHNAAMRRTLIELGHEPDALLGRELFELFPKFRATPAGHELQRAMRDRVSVQYQVLNEPGQRWFEVSASPTPDGGLAILSRDITERQHGERALRESEENLARELEAVEHLQTLSTRLIPVADPQALYEQVVDTALTITRADFASVQMLDRQHGAGNELRLLAFRGFDPESAKFWERVTPASESSCAVALRSGQRVVVPDIETCDFMAGSADLEASRRTGIRAVQTTPLRSRSGVVLGMVSTHWRTVHQPTEDDLRLLDVLARQTADFIDRQQASEELAAHERLLRLVTDHTQVGLVIVSPDHRYLYANEAYAKVHGLSTQEVVGLRVADVLPELYETQIQPRLARAFAGEHVQYDLSLPGGNGTGKSPVDARTVTIAYEPQWEAGTVKNVVIAVADITQRRAAEAEREKLLESERSARENAEKANRLKDEFLATLSHELRTPLNAILGWSHLLLKKPPVPITVEQGITVIERNARLQAQLISDLLDMSRIISGKMRLDVERVELPVLIESVLDSLRPAAEAKGVSFESNVAPITDVVQGDPARLQQVIWNLLSNAVKFTPRDGRIQVKLAQVGSHLEISVSDTGKGIRADFLPHVFERFRQADGSASREHGGLGLGLAIVKQLVELHGGHVRATSAGDGQGSTFVVELPITSKAPLVQSASLASRTETKRLSAADCNQVRLDGVRVLLVDDDADALHFVRRILKECHAEVAVADSATMALEMLAERAVDVVISDIGMPNMDGYEFIARARAAGLAAPAIALTAFARSEDRTRALLSGFQSHVSKPVESPELLATVAALVGRTATPESVG